MTKHYECPIALEHRQLARARPQDHTFHHLADLCFYHWSPTARRERIKRYGLLPGSNSLQGDWRPPYVCFSDDPNLAWTLSGNIHPEIPEWDLWMVYSESIPRWEIIFDTFSETGRHYIKEYRVYERVYKRDLIYIGSRSHE